MVIMLTGHGGIKEAVEAMKAGAVDFLEKPFSPEGLRARMARLHQIWQLQEENRQLRAQVQFQFGFDQPVGSNRTFPVDVRILAATNRDLEEETHKGNFRKDLLYRLNVVMLSVPPLKDREEDIPLLVRYVVKRFESKASPVKDISTEALACLEHSPWPGNIRELENVIRRAVALGSREKILPDDLPSNLYKSSDEPVRSKASIDDDSLDAYERAAIRNALVKSGDNRKKAAQILRIGEATLYRKIKRYGIDG